MKSFRSLILGSAFLASLAALPVPAVKAVFMFTVTEAGNDVLVTGSGSINTTALTLENEPGFFGFGGVRPDQGSLSSGSPGSYSVYTGFTGPAFFGTGDTFTQATSSTGNVAAIDGTSLPFEVAPSILVPAGYTSGSLLADSDIFAGATFASLGLTPGTYVYTWGTGANADSFTVDIVPEPSSWTLLGIGVITVGFVTLRCRRAQA